MTHRHRTWRAAPWAAVILLICLPLTSCAINPATGKRQIMLVSEGQEIAMGQENDPAIVAQFGLYDDPEMQSYVNDLGQKLAAQSERPHLDWHFRVLDDTLVNAFALPGGYIYITRGILAHFDNEAELVSVLGHEIGHVTARHGANQMSKAQLAQVGLQFGAALTPQNLQSLVDLAGAGVGIIFLQFSRDDERQADDLGLRYVLKTDYDPRPMGEVFLTLKRVSEAEGSGGSMPNWMQTHPDPENREERIAEQIDAMGGDFSASTVNRDRYLDRIDGIVFGDDPRHGYFKDNVLYHPDMKFRLDFPPEWKLTNTRQYVVAMSPQEDAMIQLVLAREDTAEGAMRTFLEQGGVANTNPANRTIHGLSALGTSFTATLRQGPAGGEVAFVEYGGQVFQILGIAGEAKWNDVRTPVATTLASFRPLTDSRLLNVEPRQIKIVRPGSAMNLTELARRFDATVPVKTLAVINGVDPGARLEVGRAYKVVRGGKLP